MEVQPVILAELKRKAFDLIEATKDKPWQDAREDVFHGLVNAYIEGFTEGKRIFQPRDSIDL